MDRFSWESVTALLSGAIVMVIGAVILFAVPNPEPDQWLVFRAILGVGAAGLGASSIGLIFRQSTAPVRILSAVALFAFVWFFNGEAISKFVPVSASSETISAASIQSAGPAGEEQKALSAIAPQIEGLIQ